MNLAFKTRLFTKFIFPALCLFAAAAQAAMSCRVTPEAIVTLNPPSLGTPFLWDAHYATQDAMTLLVSSVALPGGTVMAVGIVSGKDKAASRIVLAELDRRGRAVSEKSYPAKKGEVPVAMAEAGKNLVVLSALRNAEHAARVAWYDKGGKFIKDAVLQNNAYDYDASALATTGDDVVVAINAVNRKQARDKQGILASFDSKGAKLWQRTYSPGSGNAFDGVAVLADKSILATGRIRINDGRQAGWVMKAAANGAIMWQKTYPRGANATLEQGAAIGSGLVVSGEAMPLQGGTRAVWVMALDSDGNTIWQRYINAWNFAFSSVGLLTEDDGRVVVGISAKAVGGEGTRNHVRLVMFSPRGDFINDEAYIDGIGARAGSVIRGWTDERIVTATTDSDDKPQTDMSSPFKGTNKNPTGPIVEKGWVFVASGAEAWTDPCASP